MHRSFVLALNDRPGSFLAQERPTDQFFEAPHLQRDRRLGSAERFAGLGEAAQIDDADEGAQQIGLEIGRRLTHWGA